MDPLSWLAVLILILLSFFFSGSETALSCCNRFKFKVQADDGNKTAKAIIKLLDRFDRTLSSILVGNDIVNILASTIATLAFLDIFKPTTEDIRILVSFLSSVVITLIVYFFGDALPKTIARRIPDTITRLFTWPLTIISYALIPLTLIFSLIEKLLNKIFKSEDEDEFTEEDFENIIDKVTDDGVMDESQNEIIDNALEFADTNVKEVLTPKDKIFSLDITSLDHKTLEAILAKTKYSRIPIYEKEKDNIIGILNVKQFFKEYILNPNYSIRKILQKPYFVLSSIMIDDLFNGFKKHHTHLAIVRDNNKNIVGMVTMEDVLEEIVGGISEPSLSKEAQ